MRVSVARKSIRLFLWWFQIAMLVSGITTLSYCAFIFTGTWIFQRDAARRFDRMLLQPAPLHGPQTAAMDGLMGRIEIRRLGISAVVAEGTQSATLERAVGHISGTSLPGHSGNIVLQAIGTHFFGRCERSGKTT